MARYIRPNHSTASPRAIVLLHVEPKELFNEPSDNETELAFDFGVARYIRLRKDGVNNEDELTFDNAATFWDWIIPKLHRKSQTWLFANNVGLGLSLLQFWTLLEGKVLHLRKMIRCGSGLRTENECAENAKTLFVDSDPPTIIAVYSQCGGKLLCVDSRNYWPLDMENLGRTIGMPTVKRPDPWSRWERWNLYCQRNLDILESAIVSLIRWIKENDYGMFRWTAGSQAMAAYRHRFMKHTINVERPDRIKELERQGYYGGRIELLYAREINHDVYEMDVSSLYPSVMYGNYFPNELHSNYIDSGERDLSVTSPGLHTVAEVLVQTDNIPYPLRCCDGTYYCLGKFWTTLCGAELLSAHRQGHICATGRWARYRMRRLFDEYVEHLWEKRTECRKQQDKLYEGLCKLMLNSLYGKFGQKSPQWVDCDTPDEPWMWGQRIYRRADTGEFSRYRSIAGAIQLEREPVDHKMSFAAISAWITGYARERMRHLVSIAGSRNVYYVVNDALYVNKEGALNLQIAGEVDPNVMGKLRLKRYGKNAHFWAANNYRIGTSRVLSGVAGNATQVSETTFRDEKQQRIREVIAFKPADTVRVRKRTISLLNKVKRCNVANDGFTYPFKIDCSSTQHLQAIRRTTELLSLRDLCDLEYQPTATPTQG